MWQENHFIPFQTAELPRGPWLVFAPHPDDETFGLGGAMLLAREQGLEVSLAVVTDGKLGGSGNSVAATRATEVRAIANRLGVSDIRFLQQPDRGLSISDELTERVVSLLAEKDPASVFFTSPMEPHPDHRATAALVWEALQRCRSFSGTAYAYEVSVQQWPVNRLIDITSVAPEKMALMAVYASQLDENNYMEVVQALNRTRTYTLPAAVTHAEALYAYENVSGPFGATVAAVLSPYWRPGAGLPDDDRVAEQNGLAQTPHGRSRSHRLRETISASTQRFLPKFGTALRDSPLTPEFWRLRVVRMVRLVARYRRQARLAIEIWRSQGRTALFERLHRKLRRSRAVSREDLAVGVNLPAGPWRPLLFPDSPNPLISIVIPVHNKCEYTFHCLEAVLANSIDVSYEVILVDDASTDDTSEMLPSMGQLRVLTNQTNLGFIGSCNRGAGAANGEFIVFLNNDTAVQSGWLGALLRTFYARSDAGLVGARLIYPDGRLQEAGGIVWRDGTAWNYGRGDDPSRPEYCYLREVDYCSGACIMIARDLFERLGRFDDHYAPAYYEDTDLAFRVRSAGRRAYYQPQCKVIHYEGVTSGTSTGSGIKHYQEINAGKFFERWRTVLESHAPNGLMPEQEKERTVNRRVLVIDRYIPSPDRDSGSVRMRNLLQVLQKLSFKVTFVADDLDYRQPYAGQLQEIGVEVLYAPYVQSIEGYLGQHGADFDVVILSRADVAERHIDTARRCCPRARIVFDTVDVHFLRERRLADLTGREALARSAEARKRQELNIARRADTTLVVSPVEKDVLAQEVPDLHVAVVTNIHDAVGTTNPFSNRRDMVFVGAFDHPPNVDAVQYFIGDVLPRVCATVPNIRLHVVGSNPPPILRALASETVLIRGHVANLQPLFDSVRLSVAPLRYGAGVKGKINTSMAFGVPVVATGVAAEGMHLIHGTDVLIADDAENFAQAVVALYNDPDLWGRLSTAGLANLEQYFSFAVAQRQLGAALKHRNQVR